MPALEPVDLVLLCLDRLFKLCGIHAQAFDHPVEHPHPLVLLYRNRGRGGRGRRCRGRGGGKVAEHLVERLAPDHPGPDLVEIVARRDPARGRSIRPIYSRTPTSPP